MSFETVTIGNATLIRGDSMDILPTLGRFDAVITDPPYGIGKINQGGGRPEHFKETLNWDLSTPEKILLDLCLSKAQISIVWGGNYFELPPSRCWLSWVKPDAVPSMANIEMAWTNINQNAKHISCSIAQTNPERVAHPTQKPLKVMVFSIEQAGNPQTILDPFMGSGTTGVAAIQLGRTFTGIEREQKYFDIACERIERACAQGQLFPVSQVHQKQEILI